MLETSAVQNSFSNKSLLWSAAETLESTMLESVLLKDRLQLEQSARRGLSAGLVSSLRAPPGSPRESVSWVVGSGDETRSRPQTLRTTPLRKIREGKMYYGTNRAPRAPYQFESLT